LFIEKGKGCGGYLWPFSFLGLPSLKINAFPDDETLEEIPVLPVPAVQFMPSFFHGISPGFQLAHGRYTSSVT